MTKPFLDIDSFAGGGGASVGIEAALGKPLDIAVNHDAEALAMHRANHPETEHYNRNIWQVDPADVARIAPIRLAWFSPDCTHHSKAKGSAPIRTPEARASRDLAWVVRSCGMSADNPSMSGHGEVFLDSDAFLTLGKRMALKAPTRDQFGRVLSEPEVRQGALDRLIAEISRRREQVRVIPADQAAKAFLAGWKEGLQERALASATAEGRA